MPKVGEIRKEQHPHSKSHDAYKSKGKKFGHQGYKRKEQSTKGSGCYICGVPHGYARWPEMKNLGAILQEWKDKEVQKQVQASTTTQVGMIGLSGAITKQAKKREDYSMSWLITVQD